MEKVQWNLINKKQKGLEQSKNEKSSTIPRSSRETQEDWNNVFNFDENLEFGAFTLFDYNL